MLHPLRFISEYGMTDQFWIRFDINTPCKKYAKIMIMIKWKIIIIIMIITYFSIITITSDNDPWFTRLKIDHVISYMYLNSLKEN